MEAGPEAKAHNVTGTEDASADGTHVGSSVASADVSDTSGSGSGEMEATWHSSPPRLSRRRISSGATVSTPIAVPLTAAERQRRQRRQRDTSASAVNGNGGAATETPRRLRRLHLRRHQLGGVKQRLAQAFAWGRFSAARADNAAFLEPR